MKKEYKPIYIQFSLKQLIGEKDTILKKYNKETLQFEPILDENGQEIPAKDLTIKFPKDARVNFEDQNINLNDWVLKYTGNYYFPHHFKDGQDLGEKQDAKTRMITLKEGINYKITKTPFLKNEKGENIKDENGKNILDYKKQEVLYISANLIKEAMDSWKKQYEKERIDIDYDKEKDNDLEGIYGMEM